MMWVNTSPLVKRYTIDEFWELPEPPDYSKVELIAGVLYLTPHPDLRHSKVVSEFMRLLSVHLLRTGDKGHIYIPRTSIWNLSNTWLEPDFFYVSVSTETQPHVEYHTSADLVVEVISPESAIYDRNTKADTYAALGVKELWLVDELSGLIELRVLSGEVVETHVYVREDVLISTVLPDFQFKVGDVFGD